MIMKYDTHIDRSQDVKYTLRKVSFTSEVV